MRMKAELGFIVLPVLVLLQSHKMLPHPTPVRQVKCSWFDY